MGRSVKKTYTSGSCGCSILYYNFIDNVSIFDHICLFLFCITIF